MESLDNLVFNVDGLLIGEPSINIDKFRMKQASKIIQVYNDNGKKLELLADFRFYNSPNKSTCLSRLWLSGNYVQCVKTTKGFGYCRHSVLLCMVLESMGITWNIELSGRGLNDDIFLKLFNSLGYELPRIITIQTSEI